MWAVWDCFLGQMPQLRPCCRCPGQWSNGIGARCCGVTQDLEARCAVVVAAQRRPVIVRQHRLDADQRRGHDVADGCPHSLPVVPLRCHPRPAAGQATGSKLKLPACLPLEPPYCSCSHFASRKTLNPKPISQAGVTAAQPDCPACWQDQPEIIITPCWAPVDASCWSFPRKPGTGSEFTRLS
jgi:hypothetical protein